MHPMADISVGKIVNFDKNTLKEYPEFKNPKYNFDVGEFVCKLGFPFHNIIPHFHEKTQSFELPKGAVPLPLFPIEGMFARTRLIENEKRSVSFIETSSPGLKGQSGGPIFDKFGRIWAMQSKTIHYPLGFSPATPDGKNREHQFLNAGLGTHVETILSFLDSINVSYQVSTD